MGRLIQMLNNSASVPVLRACLSWIKVPICHGFIYSMCARITDGYLMTFHKRILEWQAAHPTITWIFWIIVWTLVLIMLLRPTRVGGMVL
jgi:hypothetical protein